jgi:hypothetical protein
VNLTDVQKLALLSALRSVLIAAGTVAVAHGWGSDGIVNLIVGGVMAAAAAAWGVVDKLRG